MNTSFAKYQATGNDFIIINSLNSELNLNADFIKKLCNRNLGIGADGLILVKKSNSADFFMDYYNSDGSIAEMCGNGIRCLASFIYDNKLANKRTIKVKTRGGLKIIKKVGDLFQVNMGVPSFKNIKIGFMSDDKMQDYPLKVNGVIVKVNGVSIGNPHCVIFTDNLNEKIVKKFGPIIENHKLFKDKINVEWAQIKSKQKINAAVWERGAGYTLACGTGACAVFAVARKKGLVENKATISLPGGKLEVKFHGKSLFLKGEAEKIFTGKVNI